MIRKCKQCGREFETNRRDVYCSFNCKKHYINEQVAMKRRLAKVNEVDLSKTFCHQCEHCETLFYTRRTRNGKIFQFKYCKGEKELVNQCSWGRNASSGRSFVGTTTKVEGHQRRFEYFLKKSDENNLIMHINSDHFDVRLKNLREISRSCIMQAAYQTKHPKSIFPGVVLTRNGKWKAQTKVDGVQVYAGVHDTELEAAHAYYKKLEELNVDINKESRAYKLYKSMMQQHRK